MAIAQISQCQSYLRRLDGATRYEVLFLLGISACVCQLADLRAGFKRKVLSEILYVGSALAIELDSLLKSSTAFPSALNLIVLLVQRYLRELHFPIMRVLLLPRMRVVISLHTFDVQKVCCI